MKKNEILSKYYKDNLDSKRYFSSRKNRQTRIRFIEGISAFVDESNRENDKIIIVKNNKVIKEIRALIFDENQISLLNNYL